MRRSRCGEETGFRRNLLRVPRWDRDGAGRKNRHRQREKGIGRSHIRHVFGIGQGCGVPAVRSQCHPDELPGDARSDAADHQLRPGDRSRRARHASGRCHEQHRARWLDDGRAGNVLPAGHGAAGGCRAAVGRLRGFLPHAVGLPERCRGEQCHGKEGRQVHRSELESHGEGAVRQELRHQRLRQRPEPDRTRRDLAQ